MTSELVVSALRRQYQDRHVQRRQAHSALKPDERRCIKRPAAKRDQRQISSNLDHYDDCEPSDESRLPSPCRQILGEALERCGLLVMFGM